jgi:hypothetical protein
VVIADLEAMRPSFLPRPLGFDFTQVVYRAIVTSPTGERGVHFLRSDADSALMAAAGSLLSNFHFHLADVVWAGRDRLASTANATLRTKPPTTTAVADDATSIRPPPNVQWLPVPDIGLPGTGMQTSVREGSATTATASGGADDDEPDRFAHFVLEPWPSATATGTAAAAATAAASAANSASTSGRGEGGGAGGSGDESTHAGIRATFDLRSASLTMPPTSAFSGRSVREAQRYFVELYAAFNAWPDRDFWSTVRIDRTEWRVVALDLTRAEFE